MKDIEKTLRAMNFSKDELETFEMVLELAKDFHDEIVPKAAGFEEEGLKLVDGKVIIPKGMEEIYKKMAESGIFGLFIDEKYGGTGLPYPLYTAVVEIISRACPCMGVALAVHGTAIDSIVELGTQTAKDLYLPKMATGEMVGAIAFTEANAGSDIGSIRMSADLQGDHYLLNGSKLFITNAGISDVYTILAVTDKEKGKKGLSAFVIDMGIEGFSVSRLEHKLGLTASPTGEIVLENYKVPKENLLGEEGRGLSYVLRGLSGGRIEIAAQAVGIAEAALRESIAYTKERKQFGQPICKFQAIQFKLADMATRISAARKMYLHAAFLKDRKEDFFTEASMAKLFASEMSIWVTNEAIQIHGGYGYTKEFGVERHYRDAKITTIYEGTSEMQRIIISRGVLS
ncbi:MAG: acyl-CoA dehydrogenase family protein [Candidatus Undinarchaeales archaeon]|nr:acyl-CoA dehydrogenase family protein [Candidatus Undinarchaeales archaeon]MDP7491997.1 acyl-CoA dehydrogenase family protein [Candidatus Undinarchaeales archaeon]